MTACKYSSNIIAYISHPVLIKVTVYGRRVVAMRKTILRPKRSNRYSFSGVLWEEWDRNKAFWGFENSNKRCFILIFPIYMHLILFQRFFYYLTSLEILSVVFRMATTQLPRRSATRGTTPSATPISSTRGPSRPALPHRLSQATWPRSPPTRARLLG